MVHPETFIQVHKNIIILKIQKKTSKQVQHKKCDLDWQLANRLSDRYVIDSAYCKFDRFNNSLPPEQPQSNDKTFKSSKNASKYLLKIHPKVNEVNVVDFEWTTKMEKPSPINLRVLKTIIDYF